MDTRDHRQQHYLRFYQFIGESPGWYGTHNNYVTKQSYPNQCLCNEYYALTKRHCLKPLQIKNPGNFQRFSETMLGWAKSNSAYFQNAGRKSHEVVMANTRADKVSRYKNAYENITTRRLRLDHNFSRITAFVKSEKTSVEKVLNKPPRLIQFRSYEYCYSLKSYLLNFGTVVKNEDTFRDILLPNRQLLRQAWTKYNDDDYNTASIIEAWNKYPDPVALLLDQIKFDGHYDEPLVSNERKFWNYLLGNKKFFDYLLSLQEKNVGYTRFGIKYSMRGKRASGDYNTSDGNTATNTFMLVTWCEVAGVTEYSIFINGDDSILICSRADMIKLLKLGLDFFNDLCMETQMDNVAYRLEEISYCQRKLCYIGSKWRWIKDPFRTLGRFVVGPEKYKTCVNKYLLGNALCELHMSYGTPILQAWCLRVIADCLSEGPDSRPLGSVDKEAARKYLSSAEPLEIKTISSSDRHSFYLAWGVTPELQIQMENDLSASPHLTPIVQTFLEKYKFFVYN